MFSLAGKVETYEKVKGKIPVVSQHNKLFKFVSAVQKLHHILQYHFAVRNKEYKEEGGQISYKEKECIQVFRNTRLLCLLYETPTISFRNIMLLLEWHTYYIKDDKVEII